MNATPTFSWSRIATLLGLTLVVIAVLTGLGRAAFLFEADMCAIMVLSLAVIGGFLYSGFKASRKGGRR